MVERAFSFKLSDSLYQDLRKLSFVREKPMSTIIRRSLFVYLNLQDSLAELTALRDGLSGDSCRKSESNIADLLTILIGGEEGSE